ncbi:DUF5777 family beta-barrel protein [Allomuricauda sp. SCSIO 65647]|uniref:DUF5777 family beta-barrel protein n=1 Tax=Allomuricauda sp. SCSIO 65647 TaxID=2908843 RepID=UPI001F2050B2|nr:DUF5777 family beta-barrel protein [Muricauda sp. SCSIO 65647]UJH66650.1 DUF5777 family beta-barrel protein [Muricauda sp. SCSIO 65647]
MKNTIRIYFALLLFPFYIFSQEKAKDSVIDKPERPAFESSFIIDNPNNVLFSKNTLEVQMSHRFGLIDGGNNDMLGFWGPSNIRIGVAYAIHERLTLGFGTTKFDRLQDFNWKVGIINQTRSGRIPVSVSYYGNFTIDARKKENFSLDQYRYSYFNQLIIARRFSPKLSMQLAPSISHFNLVEDRMRNDVIGIAFGGRYKISDQTSILWDYSQPFTHHLNGERLAIDPEPGISLGFEFATSAHAFQLFITNMNGIVPQQNYIKNTNDFFRGQILFGFNITRNYNF